MAVFKSNKPRFSLRPSKGIALQTFTKIVSLKVNTTEPFLCTKITQESERKKNLKASLIVGIVVFLILFGEVRLAGSVVATEVVTFGTDQSPFTPGVHNHGWWANAYHWGAGDENDNYFVGRVDGIECRNFFTFDLASLTETVVSARLEVVPYSYLSSASSETYGLFDVHTDTATLNYNEGTNPTIFSDLGNGVSYGTFLVERPPPPIPEPLFAISGTDSNVLTFQLNADAIANINAAAGGFFSIGGTLLTLDGTTDYFGDEGLFGFSCGTGPQYLILEVVPEPATFLLLALGAVMLRRKSKEFQK